MVFKRNIRLRQVMYWWWLNCSVSVCDFCFKTDGPGQHLGCGRRLMQLTIRKGHHSFLTQQPYLALCLSLWGEMPSWPTHCHRGIGDHSFLRYLADTHSFVSPYEETGTMTSTILLLGQAVGTDMWLPSGSLTTATPSWATNQPPRVNEFWVFITTHKCTTNVPQLL